MTRFVRQDVDRLPLEPSDSILYVSEEYEITMHLCACGCGHKVITFLGDGHRVYGDYEFPTVLPSIGVWDAKCRSHYFIKNGKTPKKEGTLTLDWAIDCPLVSIKTTAKSA